MTTGPGAPGRGRRTARARTVADLIRQGAGRFSAARLSFGHGTTSPFEEAAYLTAHALKVPPERLPALARTRVSRDREKTVLRLIEKRISERRPAAYLLREAWLAGRRFYVDERVIVPRSHIAELLQDGLSPWIAGARDIRAALDLCSGCACLAILLARSFPRASVDAADISPDALAVARINVKRHRLAQRVRVLRSDLFSALAGRRYDLIVSNPPYVTAAAMRRLPPEYRHEPRMALAGGEDGLDLVRRIVRAAAAHLTSGGLLVVEVGSGQRRVQRAFPGAGFIWPELPGGYPVFIARREQLLDRSGTD